VLSSDVQMAHNNRQELIHLELISLVYIPAPVILVVVVDLRSPTKLPRMMMTQ
jgi:hypothetical protein